VLSPSKYIPSVGQNHGDEFVAKWMVQGPPEWTMMGCSNGLNTNAVRCTSAWMVKNGSICVHVEQDHLTLRPCTCSTDVLVVRAGVACARNVGRQCLAANCVKLHFAKEQLFCRLHYYENRGHPRHTVSVKFSLFKVNRIVPM
jgi:hypothetical protein